MNELAPKDQKFITDLTSIVEENIENEQFGVSELADKAGMSRSNLLRKIKKITNESASQFIRKIRLKKGMLLVKEGELTISEISYRVGFNSTSYFIKCFREQYGFPPGELENQLEESSEEKTLKAPVKKGMKRLRFYMFVLMLISVLVYVFVQQSQSEKQIELPGKSIAVLPFINDSNDSANLYFVNGLMEAVLGNLQKISDLKVVSRRSVEKYRNTNKSISEIGKELNVRYFVEGSGQKIGNQLLLNIHLVDGSTDKRIWSSQYRKEVADVFDLQIEVAKNIASHVQVIVTPDEKARIEKKPSANVEAYDYFLKALVEMNKYSAEGLLSSQPFLRKAITLDTAFARAYAAMAMSFYYLDIYQAQKQYSDSINYYADKAMLFDNELAQTLIAKAHYYMNVGKYDLGVPYLKKALKYNPNSIMVVNQLSDYYVNYNPNTLEYLKYALKALQIDIGSKDSASLSISYLHISNAFIQNGFIDEAEKHIETSLSFDKKNIFSMYVKAYIQVAKDKNFKRLNTELRRILKIDPYRLDVMQEFAKSFYYLREFDSAYFHYNNYLKLKKKYNLAVFRHENAKIAHTFEQVGEQEIADSLWADFKVMMDGDQSIYKEIHAAIYWIHKKDIKKALSHFKNFSTEDSFHYWTVLFLKDDPLLDLIKKDPEFILYYDQMNENFEAKKAKTRKWLKKEGVLS
jgi:TolB-like protein/AraC-like DNA-binding protein/tetratricopeptide (TPR) repeat protein